MTKHIYALCTFLWKLQGDNSAQHISINDIEQYLGTKTFKTYIFKCFIIGICIEIINGICMEIIVGICIEIIIGICMEIIIGICMEIIIEICIENVQYNLPNI